MLSAAAKRIYRCN